jgi:hypothetical protein
MKKEKGGFGRRRRSRQEAKASCRGGTEAYRSGTSNAPKKNANSKLP